jgi:hypothetical protein
MAEQIKDAFNLLKKWFKGYIEYNDDGHFNPKEILAAIELSKTKITRRYSDRLQNI